MNYLKKYDSQSDYDNANHTTPSISAVVDGYLYINGVKSAFPKMPFDDIFRNPGDLFNEESILEIRTRDADGSTVYIAENGTFESIINTNGQHFHSNIENNCITSKSLTNLYTINNDDLIITNNYTYVAVWSGINAKGAGTRITKLNGQAFLSGEEITVYSGDATPTHNNASTTCIVLHNNILYLYNIVVYRD